MSVLNGSVHSQWIQILPDAFGPSLAELDYIPLDTGLEVVWQPQRALAFAGCKERLVAFKVEDGKLTQLSALPLWGGIRQCAIQGNLLAATARDEGAYLIDIANPVDMKLLKRIDTLELATGVCLYENLCLIANRHAGVEVWDVSQPVHPQYLSSFYCGEAQSVFMDHYCAYVGDWMNQKLQIFDLSQPVTPHKLAEIQVDGFADGVWVQEGKCFVASGHNSQRLKARTAYWKQSYITPQMLEDGFGCGHALTCFDVSDPEHPEFISRLAFPPLFTSHPDTWRVAVSGTFAYVADGNNGVFVVDISNLFDMRIVAHKKLGLLPSTENPLDPRYAAASAVVPLEGMLLTIGPQTGLHLLDFKEAHPAVLPSVTPMERPSAAPDACFICAGQIHALADYLGILLAACGNDGLYALTADGKPLHHLPTANAVLDVVVHLPYLLTSEGGDGIGVYQLDAVSGFRLIKHLYAPHVSVRQLAVSADLDGVGMEIGTSQIGYVSQLSRLIESDETTMTPQLFAANGPLYARHLVPSFFHHWFAAMPLTSGYTWYSVQEGVATQLPIACDHECCPIEEGIAVGHNLIYAVNRRNLYLLHDPADPLDVAHKASVPGARLTGQPHVCGHWLLLLNRIHQTVECLDLTDPLHPVWKRTWRLPGPPLHAILYKNQIYCACGHAGLFALPC